MVYRLLPQQQSEVFPQYFPASFYLLYTSMMRSSNKCKNGEITLALQMRVAAEAAS